MALDKKWEIKTILAKIEVTEGLDPVPTPAANAMDVANFTCNATSDTVTQAVNRNFFGNDKTSYTNKAYDISFEMELTGSGTVDGTPAHDPIYLACQHTGTTNAAVDRRYTPNSTSTSTITIYYYQDSVLMKATGARGSLGITAVIGESTKATVSMIAVYNSPVDATPASADYSAFRPRILNTEVLSEFSVHGTLVDGLSFGMNQNNTNERRETTETNVIANLDRKTTATGECWSKLLSAFDPFAIWEAETRDVVYWETGTAVGDVVRVSMPQAQLATPTQKDQNKVQGYGLEFIPHPTAVGTDDEYVLIFS